jgi:AraC-like DNA-binding protein
MDWNDDRVVVLAPDAVATATVIDGSHDAHGKDGTELIAGHDSFIFVVNGEGSYAINGRTGMLKPNTLIAAPAGRFSCTLTDDRELYVISVRDRSVTPDDQRTFIPFFERRLSVSDGRRWLDRMSDLAMRANAGHIFDADVAQLKNDALPYIWQREAGAAHETLRSLFDFIWDHLASPLSLEQLAAGAGYTANYLNDLTRLHTGRALGRWITDMRMARARVALEQTDLPVAEVGARCGYDDPAYFSRVFRRAYGVPPATWRIAARPVDARHSSVALPVDLLHYEHELRGLPQRLYSFAS